MVLLIADADPGIVDCTVMLLPITKALETAPDVAVAFELLVLSRLYRPIRKEFPVASEIPVNVATVPAAIFAPPPAGSML